MKFAFAILLLVLVLNEGSTEECNEDSLNACSASMQDIVRLQGNGIENAEKELSKVCQRINSMNCLTEFSKNCGAQDEFVKAMAENLKKIMSSVCNGVCPLTNCFWIIATSMLSVFLIKKTV